MWKGSSVAVSPFLVFFSFGSDKVKREFLAPSITGERVSCLGVSEAGAGSDVASKFCGAPDKIGWLVVWF